MQDTIIFMNAYESYDIKKNFFRKKGNSLKQLFFDYHLDFVAVGDSLATPAGKVSLDYQYNPFLQSTSFHFTPKDSEKNLDDFEEYLQKTTGLLNLHAAIKLLLDEQYFDIERYVALQPFLVYYETGAYQINSMIFSLNSTEMICFEVIDCETELPIGVEYIRDGKTSNFNLMPCKGYHFFDEDRTTLTNLPVPHIIMEHLSQFTEDLIDRKFKINNYSYVSNILTISNGIDDIQQLFMEVQNTNTWDTPLRNLNTSQEYEFYSAECMAVLTAIKDTSIEEGSVGQLLYHGIILEAAKLHIFITQLVNMDITTEYSKVLQNNIYIQALVCCHNAPIITHNLFDDISNSIVYKKHNEAISLKIKSLERMNDKRRSKNGLLLNILLYFLTLFGSIGFLEILESKFDIPFNITLFVLLAIFALLGGIWFWSEYRHSQT